MTDIERMREALERLEAALERVVELSSLRNDDEYKRNIAIAEGALRRCQHLVSMELAALECDRACDIVVAQ